MPYLSIFTPTHDSKFLREAYQSLLWQTFRDWEWVILPNAGKGKPVPEIPQQIVLDARVRVLEPSIHFTTIARAKHACCAECVGEGLVEFDHDDMLAPGILEKIAAAFKDGADFVYSDEAMFNEENQSPFLFDPAHGWEHYQATIFGKVFQVTRNFELTPRSLCEVYYAPDHVRCWRKEFYDRIGGHSDVLRICDDHDLICRSYLADGKFTHLPYCGYLYRFHADNTTYALSKKISEQQLVNRTKYLSPLIDKWLERKGLSSCSVCYEAQPYNAPAAAQFGLIEIHIRNPLNAIGNKLIDWLNWAHAALVPGGYIRVWFSADTPTEQAVQVQGEKKFQLVSSAKSMQTIKSQPHFKNTEMVFSALKGQRQAGLKCADSSLPIASAPTT